MAVVQEGCAFRCRRYAGSNRTRAQEASRPRRAARSTAASTLASPRCDSRRNQRSNSHRCATRATLGSTISIRVRALASPLSASQSFRRSN